MVHVVYLVTDELEEVMLTLALALASIRVRVKSPNDVTLLQLNNQSLACDTNYRPMLSALQAVMSLRCHQYEV